MIGDRREPSTITVYTQVRTGSVYADSAVHTGLKARKENTFTQELVTEAGALVMVSDVFWFDRLSTGAFPAIEEKHVLSDGTDRYEVVSVIKRPFVDRMQVATRVLR
jgi:hypothetical protein